MGQLNGASYPCGSWGGILTDSELQKQWKVLAQVAREV